MPGTVVDASAVAAVIFDEPEGAAILEGVERPLLAPTLLRYELASVCATKLARHASQAKLIVARYRLLSLLEVEYVEPDLDVLPLLARKFGLSAYDAAYLQLSLAYEAPLITLDARLARAYDAACT